MEDPKAFALHIPHGDALFSLLPTNGPAANILTHSSNRYLVSALSDPSNRRGLTYGLNIGPHVRSESRSTLATLGRSGDITVEGNNISRIHCSFEVHETTGAVMLQDRSSGQSTQTLGDTAVRFELGRTPRRVLITPEINQDFGFGGLRCDLFTFRIVWHQYNLRTVSALHHRVDNPRHARTINEMATTLPSQRVTRIHTGTNQDLQIRWSKKAELGRGQFGEVWSALNIDSGEAFAVKLIKGTALISENHLLKREVETLARISHPNIVEYITAQGPEGKPFEIFTELKDGSVDDLIQRDVFVQKHSLATHLLHHILKALDYLTAQGIIHRDVKPPNILWKLRPDGNYEYQLADFGLCNVIVDAQTFAGTPLYMAPEVVENWETGQSSKMDIWSLFVTLLWALNASSFRDKPFHTLKLRVKAVQDGASDPEFQPLAHMAAVDPDKRASAADILEMHFKGDGRTTVHDQTQDVIPAGKVLPRDGMVKVHKLQIPGLEKEKFNRRAPRRMRVTRATEKAGALIVHSNERLRRPVTRGIAKQMADS